MIRHIQNLETSDIFYISNRLKLIKLFLYVITFNIPRFQSQFTTLNNLPLEPTFSFPTNKNPSTKKHGRSNTMVAELPKTRGWLFPCACFLSKFIPAN